MSEYEYLRYEARVMTLSPLHIGTGRELLLQYDYALHGKQTWRLNEDQVLQPHYSDDPEQVARLAQTAPARLLTPGDFVPGSTFFRYVVNGQPRAREPGSVLREQIKSVQDCPYLPGSSLKGALRTVLAWQGWQSLGLTPKQDKLDRRAKFAAREYEREIFGPDPNHDLLRALQVGDSAAVAPDCLMLANVKVLTSRGEGSPIEVEAVKAETRFRLPVKVDLRLFSEWARRRQGFHLGGAREWLEDLVAIARAHAAERIKAQQAWYEHRPGSERVAGFYRDLATVTLGEGQFLLQLGWGGGWDSKTLGTRLTADESFMEGIITQYRMAKGQHQRGDAFPKSRRAVMRVTHDASGQVRETPAVPMGWVLVELKML